MKLNVVALLVVAGATGSLMSMDQNEFSPSRLNFYLGHNWRIRSYSAENMDFGMPPSEFVGKKITETIPLSEHDKNAVTRGVEKATQEQKTVTVPYTFDNTKYFATITPLIKMKRDQQRNSFFVKITDSTMEFNMPEDTLFTEDVKK